MSEQNKALVREVFDRAYDGDLDVLQQHPGLHEIIPNMTLIVQAADVHDRTIHEQLADGDWVITRATTDFTLKQDMLGFSKGSRVKSEVIMMNRVVDGIIVKQHSQVGRVDLNGS